MIRLTNIVFTLACFCLLNAGAQTELSATQQLWKNSFDAEKAGNYTQAIKFNSAILNKASSYLANLRGGWLHYLVQDYDSAVTYYSTASVMAPGAVTPLLGLSNCYTAKKDAANAIRVTASVLSLDPTNYAANKRLAELYWAEKSYSRSSVYYLKLSTLFPEDLDIASSLAWCYLNTGRTYEATIIFNNILIVNPDHAGTRAGLKKLQPVNKHPEFE